MNRSRSAFSLIELIVVIGVIGTLMAISATYVSGAKARARGVECQKNLGDWSKALGMFLDDSRTHAFPGLGSGNASDGSAWYNVLPKKLDLPTLAEYAAAEKPLPGPKSGIKSMYVCPLADKPAGSDGIFCYAANGYFTKENGSALRAANVHASDSFLVFMDAPTPGTCHATSGDILAARSNSFRHGGRMNASFLDGSVRALDKRAIVAGSDNPKKVNTANVLWDPIP